MFQKKDHNNDKITYSTTIMTFFFTLGLKNENNILHALDKISLLRCFSMKNKGYSSYFNRILPSMVDFVNRGWMNEVLVQR